jgi:hypothetical protein
VPLPQAFDVPSEHWILKAIEQGNSPCTSTAIAGHLGCSRQSLTVPLHRANRYGLIESVPGITPSAWLLTPFGTQECASAFENVPGFKAFQ